MNAQRNFFSAIVLLAGSGMAHAAGAAASAEPANVTDAQENAGVAVMEEVIVTANPNDFPTMEFLMARLRELPPIEIVTVTAKYPADLQTDTVAATRWQGPERLPPVVRVYRASPPSFDAAGPVEFTVADAAAVTVAWELDPASIEMAEQEFLPELPDVDPDSDPGHILRF